MIQYYKTLLSKQTISEFTVNGTDVISEYKPLDNIDCVVLNKYNQKIYFCILLRGGPPLNRQIRIYEYNPVNNTIYYCDIPLEPTVTSYYDTHPLGIMFIDNRGYIYMCKEKGKDSSSGLSDGHGTNLVLYRSNEKNSILTGFSKIKEIIGTYSYPRFWLNDSNLVLLGRNTFYTICSNVSNDYGFSFESERLVYTCNPSNGAYNFKIHSKDDWNYLVVCERNETSSLFFSISVIKTQDFITWCSVTEAFQKAGNISANELFENCLVTISSNYNIQSIQFEGGYVKEDGDIILLVSGGIYIGDKIEGNAKILNNLLRVYKFSNDIWTYIDLQGINEGISSYWAYDKCYRVNAGDVKDYIYYIDLNDNRALKRLSSIDDFITYTVETIKEGNGNYIMGSSPYNSDDQTQSVIIIDTITDMFDFDSYSNLIILTVNN